MADAMTGPGYFYVAINESQLLRAFGTPTTAARMSNPGYRPAYSCRLGNTFVANSLKFKIKYRRIENEYKQSIENR